MAPAAEDKAPMAAARSAAALLGSLTAAPIRLEFCDNRSITLPTAPMSAAAPLAPDWMAVIWAAMSWRRGRSARPAPHRLGAAANPRPASPARGLDCGVQRQQIDLAGDAADQGDHLAASRGGICKAVNGSAGLMGVRHGVLSDRHAVRHHVLDVAHLRRQTIRGAGGLGD
jgi:hypothetical protein